MNYRSDARVSGVDVAIRPDRRLSVALNFGNSAYKLSIFLCHGAGGSKNQWRYIWRALAQQGRHLIAWDFPGHGASPDFRKATDYAGDALVEDFAALFERHKRARNVIVAHSYGTVITLNLLGRLAAGGRLQEVDAVILLGPPPPGADLSKGPIARHRLLLLHLMRPWLSRGFKMLAWSPKADPALVAYEQRATRRNKLSMMKALVTQAARVDAHTLASLTLPITIIAGADDRLTPPQGAQALADQLPRAELLVWDGVGHQLMLEKPDGVLAVIERYLQLG